MQCPRCQQDNPPPAKFCLECGTPLKSSNESGPPGASYELLQLALSEGLERENASSEILRLISSSPNDLASVFDTILDNVLRVCDAQLGVLLLYDGDTFAMAAHRGAPPGAEEAYRRFRAGPTTGLGRMLAERQPVHIPDIRAEEAYRQGDPLRVATADLLGARTFLAVPLLKDSAVLGASVIYRREVRPFAETHIALLQTFANQAVIAIENVRLFNETREALEQQTATSEILQAISGAQTDAQPVFNAIARSTVRLCEASRCAVWRPEGNLFRCVARCEMTSGGNVVSLSPEGVLEADSLPGRVIHERQILQVNDVPDNPAVPPKYREMARVGGYRSLMAVPMVHEGLAVGVITVVRPVSAEFSDQQIRLVKTFADQAVIAIENVRLFTELQEKNQALTQAHAQVTEALEQQTATSEILRVISSSPTDVQPVFDAIVANAAQLCSAEFSAVMRFEGGLLHLVAVNNMSPAETAAYHTVYPRSPGRDFVVGRAFVEARPVHVEDIEADPDYDPRTREIIGRAARYRTILGVPVLRDGVPIGVIGCGRHEMKPFTAAQIELVKTFADQAVIAIENVRLFTELETRNAELTTALDRQTATSEILRVISGAQQDAQAVFDTIVQSAVRLCRATTAAVFRVEDGVVYHPANYGGDPEALAAARARYPRPVDIQTMPGMIVLAGSVVQIPDSEEVGLPDHVRQVGRILGFRSVVGVPMLREGEAVGALLVTRREPGRFSDPEVELLKTFSDQAVIAIENVRLFKELEARTAALTRSVDQLTALGEVGRAVSSTLDLETVLATIVSRAVELSGLDGGVVFEYDERAEEFMQRAAAETGGILAQARRGTRYRKGEGVVGRTAITLEPVQVPDISVPGAYVGRMRENLIDSGIRALLAVPMVREDRLIGCLVVSRNRPGDFPAETIELLRTFATQSALAIQNARLFLEIADKSRQIEVASQHKSEFLANMSHELRTPLNAILGFSEVLAQGMFGGVNEKQAEYLHDILESGRHLLSLINDILDLSKIEAGRMELELSEFDLPQAIQNALTLVRERALRRGIALHYNINDRIGQIRADERKIKQVLLNLLSNAIKFTPEGGQIEVRAAPMDGRVEVAVSDTGIGIAPEDLETVFEEFRQVGTADKKAEGTGLGLALAKRFVELHGGRIWVESAVGRGSTFTFTLPMS